MNQLINRFFIVSAFSLMITSCNLQGLSSTQMNSPSESKEHPLNQPSVSSEENPTPTREICRQNTSATLAEIQFQFGSSIDETKREILENDIRQIFDRIPDSKKILFSRKIRLSTDPLTMGVGVGIDENCETVNSVTFPAFQTEEEMKNALSELIKILIEERNSDEAVEIELEDEEVASDFGVEITHDDSVQVFRQLFAILWPVKSGIINSPFGYRVHPVTGQRKLHKGSDLKAPQGELIYNGQDGTVQSAGNMGSCGLGVIVKHTNGYQTVYCHMSQIITAVGKTLTTQSQIGRVGKTGMATGPHLHLGLKLNGGFIDPKPHLARR